MKRLGQELGWVAVVAAVFLLPGFAGCTATLEGAPPARPAEKPPVFETSTTEDVMVSDASGDVSSEGVDPALAAYAASTVDVPAPQSEVPGAAPVVAEDAPLEATLRVHEIELAERHGDQEITLHFSRSPDDMVYFPLDSPSRLVVDVAGPVSGGGNVSRYEIGSSDIDRIRIGEHPNKLRIVADLVGAAPRHYSVAQDGRAIVLTMPVMGAPRTNETVFLAPGVLPASLRPRAVAAAAPHPVEPAALESDPNVGLATTAEPVETDETTDQLASETETEPVDVAAPTDVEIDEPALDPAYSTEPVVLADAADVRAEIPVTGVQEIPGDDEALSPIDHVYEISDEAIAEAVAETPDENALDAVAGTDPADVGALREWSREEPTAVAAVEEPTYLFPVQAVDDEYTGQRISLDFKDADIQNVLRILADVSDLNIITTDDVDGRLTIRLVNVPWDQALDSILKAQGLDMVRDGNIVRISTVERLKEERDAQRAANEAQKQAEPLLVRYIRVNYAKADEELVKKVQEVLTERGTATWDERTNTVVVRDIARGLTNAEELITQFDTQTPQVLIEANIVEATESFARDLGVQWGYTYNSGPEIGNSSGNNFPGRVGAGGILAGGENSPASVVPFIADFPASSVAPGAGAAYDLLLGSLDGAHSLNARLTALERQGKGKIISRPRVVTLNNVAAKIESLEILRVRLPSTGTVISTGAGGAAGAAQNATEQIRTGIVLEVTPQVSSDGYIFLDVYAKSSALVAPEQSQAPSPDDIPNEVSREAESHVLIKDGETFVLGGVFRNVLDTNDQGLPFLSQIPVLGWAFKNSRDIDNRQELLVFVTPRAVRARGTENLASLPSAESLWQNRENP